VSASQPVYVKIRIVMMPGEESETVLTLDEQTIEEGEMWGRAMKDINRWVDASGRIKIKFIIYFLRVF